jgi:O-succinylbenzoic acid--CoA ligase
LSGLHLRPRTIRPLDEWLTRASRERPGHPAIEAGGRSVTYVQLAERRDRLARRLAARGIGPGDRVRTTLPPGLAFAELLHALPRLGAVLVPLRPDGEAPVRGPEADVPLLEEVDPAAVHSVIHTSGTTGEPRPVELTYGNHWASALASAWNLGVDPDDRWLCCLPLFHVGGLAVLLRSAIYATTAVIHERFEIGAVRRALESGGITLVSLVPTMLRRLLEAGLSEAPALRAILLGGGPVPPDLLDCGLPVVPTYGMTETASQVVTGSPGTALPGVELRIGEDGEVLVRGPMVAPGAPAADGWLHTGDRGRLDAEGRLHVEGRIKELIVTGGENVSPVEVEHALAGHPAVADVAVAGLPDAEWGEAVTAFVVLREPEDPDKLREWCRERLAPYKVPRHIEQVEALPRNPAGKLLRDRLAPRARD